MLFKQEVMVAWARSPQGSEEERTGSTYILEIKPTELLEEYETRGYGVNEDNPRLRDEHWEDADPIG